MSIVSRRGFITSLFAAAAAALLPAPVAKAWKTIGTFGGQKNLRMFVDGIEEHADGNSFDFVGGDYIIDCWLRRADVAPGCVYLDELRVRSPEPDKFDPDKFEIKWDKVVPKVPDDDKWHRILITK